MIIGKGMNVFFGHIFFLRTNDNGTTKVGYFKDGRECWYDSPVDHARLCKRYCDESSEYLRAHPIVPR